MNLCLKHPNTCRPTPTNMEFVSHIARTARRLMWQEKGGRKRTQMGLGREVS